MRALERSHADTAPSVLGMSLLILAALCCTEALAQPPPYTPALDNGTLGSYPVRTYTTENDMTSPRVNWVQSSAACNDGLLTFLTPRGHAVKLPGPMILDNQGELVWSRPHDTASGGQTYGLRVQQYNSTPYLTFWLGDDLVQGHGSGSYYMLNSSYDVIYTVNAAGGLDADLHEFLITPDGKALIIAYERRLIDKADGSNSSSSIYIWDGLIQENDIQTGMLSFQWRASDHIDLSESYQTSDREGTYDQPWDCYHINSIEKDERGNFLVSARYLSSIIYIEGGSGNILWRLGGRKSDFHGIEDNNSVSFTWQHDARFHEPVAFPHIYTPPSRDGCEIRLISLFDNGRDQQHSQGLLLELIYPLASIDDPKDHSLYTVRTIKAYNNSEQLRSSSQGSMQIINDNSKILLGYGYNAVWTEFDINGSMLCNAHFGAQSAWETGDVQSYRVYKYAWVGMPHTPPKLEQSEDGLSFFASWNGATEVRTWVMQAANDIYSGAEHWTEVRRTSKQGFETVIPSPISRLRSKRFLRVLALDQNGALLPYGVSNPLDRGEVGVGLMSRLEDAMS